MAYGQVNPARLEGEALRRWYLRSPAEIEEERRKAADRAHDEFFGTRPRSPAVQVALRAKATPGGCINCHGNGPMPPLPPPFGTIPIPEWVIPTIRKGLRPGSGGGKEHPKQCEQQYNYDSGICRGLDAPQDRAVCWESASERKRYCLSHDGEIGWPPLLTSAE